MMHLKGNLKKGQTFIRQKNLEPTIKLSDTRTQFQRKNQEGKTQYFLQRKRDTVPRWVTGKAIVIRIIMEVLLEVENLLKEEKKKNKIALL